MENSTLHTVEMIHWVALAFMGLVYTIRLFWILKFNAGITPYPDIFSRIIPC